MTYEDVVIGPDLVNRTFSNGRKILGLGKSEQNPLPGIQIRRGLIRRAVLDSLPHLGHVSRHGGWFGTDRGGFVQGYDSYFSMFRNQILDRITQEFTGFDSFLALLDAPGYRPTFRCDIWQCALLADAYDAAQRDSGDLRRAHRIAEKYAYRS